MMAAISMTIKLSNDQVNSGEDLDASPHPLVNLGVIMRRPILYSFFLLLLAPTAIAEPLALVPDALIDGLSDQAQSGRAVLIEGEYIVDVVDIDTLPPDIRTLQLPGQTLMPGLINGHEHPLIYGDNYQNAHLSGSSAYKTLLGLGSSGPPHHRCWTLFIDHRRRRRHQLPLPRASYDQRRVHRRRPHGSTSRCAAGN